MEGSIKVNTAVTKNMELEHFIGLMDVNTMGLGKMASNMVEANTIWPLAKKRQANGWKVKGLSGYSRILKKAID